MLGGVVPVDNSYRDEFLSILLANVIIVQMLDDLKRSSLRLPLKSGQSTRNFLATSSGNIFNATKADAGAFFAL